MKTQQEFRKCAQDLRRNMTKEERHLWHDFLKTYPIQFRRQYQIGCYIVDFYCYQAKLVIELDGSQHYSAEGSDYDRKRSAFLETQGIHVMRFSNTDVMKEFSAVCQMIDMAVRQRVSRV